MARISNTRARFPSLLALITLPVAVFFIAHPALAADNSPIYGSQEVSGGIVGGQIEHLLPPNAALAAQGSGRAGLTLAFATPASAIDRSGLGQLEQPGSSLSPPIRLAHDAYRWCKWRKRGPKVWVCRLRDMQDLEKPTCRVSPFVPHCVFHGNCTLGKCGSSPH